MTVDFAIGCSLVRPGRPRYPVFVHRAAGLLHASFRPHLAMTPLRFANPSPPSGWVKDFHLQAVDHARHTRKRPPTQAALLFFEFSDLLAEFFFHIADHLRRGAVWELFRQLATSDEFGF